MSSRTVVNFEEQTGITTTSEAFVLNPLRPTVAVARLVSGTPTTGARLQVTVDDAERIVAGTATWVNSPMGLRTSTGGERLNPPVTGVRLSATDGTWALQVRQG